MLQNLQSLSNQNVVNVKFKISRGHPTNKLRGNLRGKLHEGQGRLSGWSPLRSDGSPDSQAGKLDRVSGGQRELKGGH
jgi:hypothetical protein